MGLRVRKSINIGLGFRVNISKDGIGYSWGVPGYRKSVSATGKRTTTYSIPGTGISYVETHNKKQKTVQQENMDVGPEQEIRSANIQNFQQGEFSEFTAVLSRIIFLNDLSTVIIVASLLFCPLFVPLLLLSLIGFAIKIYCRSKSRNCITYEMDEFSELFYKDQVESIMALNKCRKLWQIISQSQVYNKKVHAGASRLITRNVVKVTKSVPFYLNSNIRFPNIKLKRERIFFLPDKILIVHGSKVGAVGYDEAKITTSSTTFTESGFFTLDAKVLGYTWKYVNKNGTRDKRFANNRKLTVCEYGKMTISSKSGLQIELQGSNLNIVKGVKL